MYISLVLGVINTFCEGTIILLIDRLTNIYPISVITVVMVMVSPCESLLWYREYDCRNASAPTATIGAIAKALWLIYSQQENNILYYI